MARKTDPNKIEKVKKAAIEMMIEYGYKGASIADIAKKAGVSTGYLYRYYSSKEELVEDLVDTYIKEMKESIMKIFSQNKNCDEMIYDFVFILFQQAKNDIFITKFVTTLVFETQFEGKCEKKEKEIHECMQKIVDRGLITKEINAEVTVEEVVIVLLTIPFMYVAQKIKEENYKELLNEKSAKRIAQICINALK